MDTCWRAGKLRASGLTRTRQEQRGWSVQTAIGTHAEDFPESLIRYYRSPAVRMRIAEFCGGRLDDPGTFTALSLAGYGGRRRLQAPEGSPLMLPLSAWPGLLQEGADICRSVADREGSLLMFDIDYVNHADAAEPYRDPARTFRRLEPVYQATVDTLASYGVRPLTLITGRGYHMIAKAPNESPFGSALGRISAQSLDPMHDGAGRLLEYVAHCVIRRVGARCEVPLTLIDWPPPGGGPFICLDTSSYGDPVGVRNARCAFSGNQKAHHQELPCPAPVVAVLPRKGESLDELLAVRSDLRAAADWASTCVTGIPLVRDAPEWLTSYEASALASFHRFFDALPIDLDGGAFDKLDLGALPGCVAFPLTHPNAALLTPGWLHAVTLALSALGWHPQAVVSLVLSRYGQPHDWGNYWERYDPLFRASFYVRVCAGAVADGTESWDAFSCASQRATGYCPGGSCDFELACLPRPG